MDSNHFEAPAQDPAPAPTANLPADLSADLMLALRGRVAADPADWRAALAYKAALAAKGRHAEADATFRLARTAFPDAVWVAHLLPLNAFPHAELPSLLARAHRLAAAAPDDGGRARLLGNLLLQARRYREAAAAFARAPDADSALRRQEALAYLALADAVARAPPDGPAPSVAVINLDRNADRWADAQARFAGCRMPLFRVPGVDGATLPAAAISRHGADPARPGTLGCFLAHARAWQAVASRGLSHCLVVEDDALPLLDLPARWGVFGLPDDVELCFVNDRMAPRAEAFGVLPVAEALARFPPERNAPGMDGYLLSASGARRLLALVGADGFAGDVDWRVVAYARSGALRAAVLAPPLIRAASVSSEREDANREREVSKQSFSEEKDQKTFVR